MSSPGQGRGSGGLFGSSSGNRRSGASTVAARQTLLKHLMRVFESLDIDASGGVSFDEIVGALFANEPRRLRDRMMAWAEKSAGERRRRGLPAGGLAREATPQRGAGLGEKQRHAFTPEQETQLLDLFSMWDSNSDGFLSVAELADVMKRTGLFGADDAQAEFEYVLFSRGMHTRQPFQIPHRSCRPFVLLSPILSFALPFFLSHCCCVVLYLGRLRKREGVNNSY